jgi:DNA-binding XRE family transcriptional regulator
MPPIEHMTVTLDSLGRKPKTFVLPSHMEKELIGFISARVKEKPVPATEVFPELDDDTARPATMLRGARYKADMTQKELADLLSIKQHHLSEMENGKRPIGKAMAKRLAEALACDYRLFV